jgi:4-diphosphocytidyl-2-C-methyl-D-erythritol kinase
VAEAAGAELVEAAPAKLNLYLHVLGRRDDGYHRLDSLVAFADVGDVVAAAPGDGLTLAIDGPFASALAADEDNLVLRAARLLADRLGHAPRARLRLIKNLPVASGIGGGSSDAAACLRALMRLWRAELPAAELSALALRLGADVPVCLARRPSWLGGIGDELAPAPALPPAGLLLVNPGVALPTPAVFRARGGEFGAPARFDRAPRDAASLAALLAERRNDLTAAAAGIVPAVADILAALERLPQGDYFNRVELNREFHFVMIAAVDNVVLSELYQSLGARQQRVAMTAIHTDPTRISRISREHHALVAALTEWDEEKALAILEQHLRPIVGVISRLPEEAAEI